MLRGVLIVGEAPGEFEAKEGKPFVGAAGKLLDHLLRLAGLNRDDFAVHNVISCRPPNNELRGTPYEREAIEHCRPNLDDTIKSLRPKVIIALGNTPLERLTGRSGITRFRGYPLRGPFDTWVIPTFHPSYLLPRRGQKSTSHLTPAVIRDFKLALEIAERGYSRPTPIYLEDPPVSRAGAFYLEWVNAGCPPLSIDIETPYKLTTRDEEGLDTLDTQIIRTGYCFRPNYAMSIPNTPEYESVHKAFIERHRDTPDDKPIQKIVWNGYHFDMPTIRAATNWKLGGEWIDGMWAFHYLQPDLPRGLESVGSYYFNQPPWKHLSKENPALYNCMDADAALQNWIGIERGLRMKGQYEGFFEYLVELDPILQEAGNNGIHIDRRARRILYKKLRKEENRLLREVQPLIPQELRPLKHYKRYPKVWDNKRQIIPVFVEGSEKVCTRCGASGVTKGGHTSRKGGKNGIPLNECYKAEIVVQNGRVCEFDVVMDWNPNSSDQLIAYCKHVGHPVGKHPKTKSETVDDNHLEVLIEQYGDEFPIYKLVTDIRTVGKSLSTYVKGLRPDESGVVRTQYSYSPATGRLSSKGIQRGSDRGVNIQNIPHRGEHPYASDIRRMIIPPAGYVFVEADSSAIEAVMTGHFMGDDEYIRMSHEGIHDAFALKSLHKENTAANRKAFKDASKVNGSDEHILRDRKKRTVHGVSYGMGPRLMHMQYRKAFPSVRVAEKEIDAFYEFVPKLKEWHHKTRVQAHETTYLQLPFGGYRRYFYDVFSYVRDRQGNVILKEDGSPKIKLGEDGKACIAMLPQGSAAMFMRMNAKNIANDIRKSKFMWILPGNYLVHDSYCLCVPDNPIDVENAADLLEKHLTRPIPEMGGLRVGCEIKVGHNWEEMETIRVVKV